MSVSTKTVWLSKPQNFTTEWSFSVTGLVKKINMASPFYGYSIVIRDAVSEILNDITNNNPLSTGVSTTAYDQIIIEFDNYKNTALQDIENPHISILHTSLHHINELVTVPLHQSLDRDFKIDIFYKNGYLKVLYNNRIILNQTVDLSSYLSSSSLLGYAAYTEDNYHIHVKSMNFKNKIEPYYSKWGAYPLEIGMDLSSHAFSATGFEYLIRLPRTTHNLEVAEVDDIRLESIENPQNVQSSYNNSLEILTLTWDLMPGYDAFLVIRDGIERGLTYVNSYTDTGVVSGTYSYRVVAYKAGGFISKPSDPILVNTFAPIIFSHLFLSSNPLDDSSAENNIYIEQADNTSTFAVFDHQFLNNLEDSTTANNDYVEDTTVYNVSNPLFEHRFLNNLEDSTTANNDYFELSTEYTKTILDVRVNNTGAYDNTGNGYTVTTVGTPSIVTDFYAPALDLDTGSKAVRVFDSSLYEYPNHDTGILEFKKNNTGLIRLVSKDTGGEQYRFGILADDTMFWIFTSTNYPSLNPAYLKFNTSVYPWVTGRIYKLAWCLDLDSDTFFILIKDVWTNLITKLPYTIQSGVGYYSNISDFPEIINASYDLYLGNDSGSNQPVGLFYRLRKFNNVLSELEMADILIN